MEWVKAREDIASRVAEDHDSESMPGAQQRKIITHRKAKRRK